MKILFLFLRSGFMFKIMISIGKVYMAKDSWIRIPKIFKTFNINIFGSLCLQIFKIIRKISISNISFLIKKSPIIGANKTPGDSRNTFETLFLASLKINLIKRKYEKMQINQIKKIGEIFSEFDKKYIVSPNKPLLTNPPW